MQYIETAYRGRVKMIQTIFGRHDGQAHTSVKSSKRPMTSKLFDVLFGGSRK